MIRIYKRPDTPASLTRSNNAIYNNQDVQAAILEDQKGKCYVCERICVTDYEIDHFLPVSKYPDRELSWENLFLACGYCNRKKSGSFDNILNPTRENIEDLIKMEHDAGKKLICFTTENKMEEIGLTIRLLNKVFNGNGKIREIREEKFYEYFLSRINVFMSNIISYSERKDKISKDIIIEQLSVDSEFLAFKYSVIIKNERLFSDFRNYITWNKQ